MRQKLVAGLILIFLGLVSAAWLAETAIPVAKSQVDSIALFKNGLGYFQRSVDIPKGSSEIILDEVPQAFLGTLWVAIDGGIGNLKDMVGFKEKVTEEARAVSIAEILEANEGKEVKLMIGGDTLTGKLIYVAKQREPVVLPTISYGPSSYYSPPPPSPAPSLVLLKTDKEIVALNKGAISQVIVSGKEMKDKVSIEREVQQLKLSLYKPGSSQTQISYLQKGICWVPNYSIDLVDEGKAELSMKALVINDVEDLEAVDVQFTVGFPHYLYSNVLSPLAMRQDLNAFINSLLQRSQEFRGRAAMLAQNVAGFYAEAEAAAPEFGYSPTQLTGEFQEDLFFYGKRKVTLKKGDRGYYPMFKEKVDYEHVYEWTIPDTILNQRNSRQQEEKPKDVVWHSVKLTNSTEFPWTTGAALTMKNHLPLGQDMLNYTSIGATINVKITQATDVKVERSEYETNREVLQKPIYGYYYDLVTVKGELIINNYKNKDIALEITKNLTGEVISTTHEGKVELIAEGLKAVNPNSVIKWQLSVPQKDKVKVEYQFKVYIRR